MVSRRGRGQTPLVGLVLEGPTEYAALPGMLQRLGVRCTTPSCYRGQTVEAPLEALVGRKLLPHVRVQLAKGADRVIVLVDRERRKQSAQAFRAALLGELKKQVGVAEGQTAAARISVIVCDRTFENWLIADPKGILTSSYIETDLTRQVDCHADGKDALSILKTVFRKGKSYRKAIHGPRLAQRVRVEDGRVRLCSASLRAFVERARTPCVARPKG